MDASAAPDLVTGDLRRTLFRLGLPVLVEQLLLFCVGFVDTYLSGRFGATATGAVGLASYVGWLVSMLFGLVTAGTAALVARHWGAGEFEAANRVLNRSLALAAVLGGLVFVLLTLTAPGLTWLIGMTGDGREIAIGYLRRDAFGHLFTGITLAGAAAFRGSGNTRTPMFVLGSVSAINMAASWALAMGLGPLPAIGIDGPLVTPWGVDGIVAGTVLARACGGLLMLACLARGIGGIGLRISELRLWDETVARLARIGIPAAADGVFQWSGHYLFLIIIRRLPGGEIAFAAHMIGIEVEAISYLPAFAWGVASATMTGQALGRGDLPRARRVGHSAAGIGAFFAVVLGAAFYFGADRIYAFMHENPEVRAIGAPAFRMLAFFQPPLALAIVYAQTLRGAGDTRSPMVIAFLGVFLVRLPLAWLCGLHLGGGLLGAWVGMCGDMSLRAILTAAWFATGRWVRVKA